MSPGDLGIALQFGTALEEAARTGDFAYQRDLHTEVMIHGGKIARYEIRPTP